jgi:hypothetical protein
MGSKEEAKFNRRNRLPVNKILLLALLSKLIFGFSVWSKPVVGIIIEGGFDTNILGLILIFFSQKTIEGPRKCRNCKDFDPAALLLSFPRKRETRKRFAKAICFNIQH